MNTDPERSTIFRNAIRRQRVIEAFATGESGAPMLERALASAMFDAFCVWQARQKKYGPNNIAKRREVGVLVRIDDKLSRLAKTYFEQGTAYTTPDESIEDSWLDLANYGLIGLLLHRGAWPQYESPFDHLPEGST